MFFKGFDHENNRPDRESYVNVVISEIQDGSKKKVFLTQAKVTFFYLDAKELFKIVPNENYIDYGTPYDYESIMHLSSNSFAKNKGSRTIIPKNNNKVIQSNDSLSVSDAYEIHLLYECSSDLAKKGKN